MNFTENQAKAIHSTKRIIVVNSSAGTGKTTVLSHRIIHFIKQGWNITDFLALTFTNNAAKEMQSRIEKLLREAIKHQVTITSKQHLQKQLELLPSAYITTFHSFCKRMIEENFTILNASPIMKISSESQFEKIVEDSIEETFELMMKDKKNYLDLYNYYKKSNEKGFAKVMINFLSLISYNENTLNIYLENNLNLYSNKEEERFPSEYIRLLKESNLLEHLAILINDRKIISMKNNNHLEVLSKCIDYLENEGTKKELKTRISKEYKNSSFIKTLERCLTIEDAKPFLQSVQRGIKWIYNFTEQLKILVDKKKSLLGLNTFDDLILNFLKMIDDKDFLKNTIDKKFKEVMIDEFQDTSDYQFAFVKKLVKPRLFIVGDKKQSIFRFQGAKPELFESIMMKAMESKEGDVINLDQNFGSNKNILSFVNDSFSVIANALGTSSFTYGKSDSFKLLDGPANKKSITEIFVEKDTNEYKDFVESCFQQILFYKSKNSDYQFSDFMILSPTNLNFLEVKRLSVKYDIPIKLTAKTPASSSPLISMSFNLLKLIENEFDDDALIASLLHVFSFTEEEITRIKIWFNKQDNVQVQSTKNFYSILNYYSQFGDNALIKQRTQNVIEDLKMLLKKFRNMNLKELIFYLFNDFNLLSKCIEKGSEEEAMSWYRILLTCLENVEDQGEKSISSLIEAISSNDENLQERVENSISTASDAVQIMTCHKSKGLESKVVFFLNKSGKKINTITIDPLEGIHLDYDTPEDNMKIRIPHRHLLEYKEKTLSMYDYIRLLYVVFTRAKEELVIVSSIRKNTITNDHIILKTNMEQIIDLLSNSSIWEKWVKKVTKETDVQWGNFYHEIMKKFQDHKNSVKDIAEIKLPKSLKSVDTSLTGKKIKKFTPQKMLPLEQALQEIDVKGTDYGTKVHKAFEKYFLDIESKGEVFFEEIKKNFLLNKEVVNIMKNSIQILTEVPIFYVNSRKERIRGIIDLLIMCKQCTYIIDYKTDNVDSIQVLLERHSEQLNSYKNVVEKKSNNVKAFIYTTRFNKLIEVKR